MFRGQRKLSFACPRLFYVTPSGIKPDDRIELSKTFSAGPLSCTPDEAACKTVRERTLLHHFLRFFPALQNSHRTALSLQVNLVNFFVT